MAPRRARIQDVLKVKINVKVKVKGHVIRTLLLFHENCFYLQAKILLSRRRRETRGLTANKPRKKLRVNRRENRGKFVTIGQTSIFQSSRIVCDKTACPLTYITFLQSVAHYK